MAKKADNKKRRVQRVVVEFHPRVDKDEFRKQWNLFRQGLPIAFELITGLPRGLLRGEHRAKVEKAVMGQYPNLRKSALRLFMEGYLTGDDGPLQTMPVGTKRRLDQVVGFLDVLETLVYLDGERRLREETRIVKNRPTRIVRRPVLDGPPGTTPKGAGTTSDENEPGENEDETEAGDGEGDEGLDDLLEDLEESDPDGDIAAAESLADELDERE